MSEQWYYTTNGQRTGPVSEEQLRELVASGKVQATDLVWKKGMAQWAQASQHFSLPAPDPNEPPPTPDTAKPGQPDWQAQIQGKAREATKKVREFAQSEQAKQAAEKAKQASEKAKSWWRGLSGRNKAIVSCVGVLCLYLLWRILLGGGSSYTPDDLLSLVEKDVSSAKSRLESKWITVTGQVEEAMYLAQGAPLALIAKNTSAIKLRSRSNGFGVEAFFEGPKSGGVETDSLSRGDTVTVKGKVRTVADKVVALQLGEIVSVRRQ